VVELIRASACLDRGCARLLCDGGEVHAHVSSHDVGEGVHSTINSWTCFVFGVL